MKIVTAMAPRCGTSFVMQQCIQAGLPVNATPFVNGELTPREGNPEGYFERATAPQKGKIQKVWPVELAGIDPGDIDALVVLDRRDKQALFRSMDQQAKREQLDYPSEQAYAEISGTLRSYLDTTGIAYLLVYTEELDDRIDEILTYFGKR